MAKAGAPPKFDEAHVNWVFWKIANNEPMGRKMAVQETGLGEGSVRTILDKLDQYGLVKSARSGRALSEDGKKVVQRMKQLMRVEKTGAMEMTGADNNCLVLVKQAAGNVGEGMEQRDAAIKVGGSGATTLVVASGRLMMPGFDESIDMGDRYSRDVERIREILDPEEGDVVVIGSERDPRKAEEAAWVAASTLL